MIFCPGFIRTCHMYPWRLGWNILVHYLRLYQRLIGKMKWDLTLGDVLDWRCPQYVTCSDKRWTDSPELSSGYGLINLPEIKGLGACVQQHPKWTLMGYFLISCVILTPLWHNLLEISTGNDIWTMLKGKQDSQYFASSTCSEIAR